jgi:hypothetical protein
LRRIEVCAFTSFRVNEYGPADGYELVTSCVSGSFVEVAWKNGIVSFKRNEPSGFIRRMISVCGPFTLTPLTCVAWPAFTARAPTISVPFGSAMNCAPGDARSWFATLSIAYAKLLAVTGVPSLKRKPLRRKNVYVLPRFEIATRDATSGTSRLPPSGQL